MVALSNRKRIQEDSSPPWEFHFPALHCTAYVWDNIEAREVKLHAGLNIVVVLEGQYSDGSDEIAESFSSRILDILSFINLAQCDVPKLISRIVIKDDGTSIGAFFQQSDPDSMIVVGTPRTVDKDIFLRVWKACDGSPHEQRVFLALEWLRKAIREKYIIDQFISYWVALEISNSTLRVILKNKSTKSVPKWGPVTDVFNTVVDSIDFDKVKAARNYILHGNGPMTPEFVSRMRTYITPTRSAVVYMVTRTLGLDDTIANTIVTKEPRRMFRDPTLGLTGYFENLPIGINELLNNYPEIRTQGKPSRYSIRDTGELDISFKTTYTAKLLPGVKFNATGSFAIGEENAGIKGISNASLEDE